MQGERSVQPRLVLAILGAVALACALGSAGLISWRSRQPRMLPTSAAGLFIGSLRDADLATMRASCATDVARTIVEVLCRPRFERARGVYSEVFPQLAQPEWRRLRYKAEAIAAEEWERLRYRIDELGRERLVELGARDQEALTSNPQMYWAFALCAGIAALSETDRVKASDPESFSLRRRTADSSTVSPFGCFRRCSSARKQPCRQSATRAHRSQGATRRASGAEQVN